MFFPQFDIIRLLIPNIFLLHPIRNEVYKALERLKRPEEKERLNLPADISNNLKLRFCIIIIEQKFHHNTANMITNSRRFEATCDDTVQLRVIIEDALNISNKELYEADERV